MARSIVGLFADRTAAERAIVDLKSAGFDPAQMGIVMRDREEARQTAEDEGVGSTAGAVTGELIGGAGGAMLAATGALVVPGIGPFIAGGILASALVGGVAGWLIGGLVGLGVPEAEARYYQSRVEGGSVLLTLATPYHAQEAWEIMRRNGAEDLHAKGFGEAPGQEIGRVYAEPPRDEVDGTVVPPANREDSYELEGNAVSSLTDAQHRYRPEPLPREGRPGFRTEPLPRHDEEDDQTAHQPPVRENDVLIGGWDAPDHPTTDADILQKDTGHYGQPERPEQ